MCQDFLLSFCLTIWDTIQFRLHSFFSSQAPGVGERRYFMRLASCGRRGLSQDLYISANHTSVTVQWEASMVSWRPSLVMADGWWQVMMMVTPPPSPDSQLAFVRILKTFYFMILWVFISKFLALFFCQILKEKFSLKSD